MRAKHQRLTLVLLAGGAVLVAVLIAIWGLRDRAAYFYTPSDVERIGIQPDRHVRLGGMVKQGSLVREPDGVTIRFVVADEARTVPVVYAGIVPDLFREGSGVVADGRFAADGRFTADTILAKHDERYMPPELAGTQHKTASLEE